MAYHSVQELVPPRLACESRVWNEMQSAYVVMHEDLGIWGVFTATKKKAVLWGVTPCGSYRNHKASLIFLFSVLQLLLTANVPSSLILSILMTEAIRSSIKSAVKKMSHGVTSQTTAFFIVIAVKTSNLT
jgi:hypothetical protein